MKLKDFIIAFLIVLAVTITVFFLKMAVLMEIEKAKCDCEDRLMVIETNQEWLMKCKSRSTAPVIFSPVPTESVLRNAD